MGFDFMFSIFPVIFGVMFVVVLGVIIASVVRGGKQWHRNNQSPVLTVDATVVTKRTETSHHHHHDTNHMSHTTSSTYYYATFQVQSGDRMELGISGQEYGYLVEGDQGQLTFQGTRYLGFQRA